MIKPRKLSTLMQRTAELISTSRYDPTRHTCFVAYHDADFSEVENFVRQLGTEFIPRCVGVTEQDRFTKSLDDEFIMSQVRREYLGDSTVTIVLVGRQTWYQRFVDWAIAASLHDGLSYHRSGLLVLPLPSLGNKAILPERIRDNFYGADNEKSYAIYEGYPSSPGVFRAQIARAHEARVDPKREVDNSRPLLRSDNPT